MNVRRLGLVVVLASFLLPAGLPRAQVGGDSQQNIPQEIPPPLPPREPREEAPEYRSVIRRESQDLQWGLDRELMGKLHDRVAVYQDYARKFTCDETARMADYDRSGAVDDERVRHYGYLLQRDPVGGSFRELRQSMSKDGRLKDGDVEDVEPFPPAYAWVFLFSRFNEPYFAFRHLGTDFDGFDLVHTIEFRGALQFTDGKDIRQWEGKVTIDAFTLTPLEIEAEPANQRERVEELFRNWNQAFSILGFKTKKPPLLYKANVQFRYKRDRLTFPTELRYDTQRAVSPTQVVPVRASIRSYRKYLFTGVATQEQVDSP